MSGSSGGDKKPPDRNDQQPVNPPGPATTYASALGGVTSNEVRMRNFAEIIAETFLKYTW